MAQGWQSDKRWSDRFLTEIKRILGEHLIGEPPVEEDQERNTDLIVLKMEAVRIACRVRRAEHFDRYSTQFTIREGRPSGVKTELAKIVEGWGDYLFYAFAAWDQKTLQQWVLIDLKVFRAWYSAHIEAHAGQRPGIGKANKDGSSSFRSFWLAPLADSEGIVACQWGNANGQRGLFA